MFLSKQKNKLRLILDARRATIRVELNCFRFIATNLRVLNLDHPSAQMYAEGDFLLTLFRLRRR